MRGGETMNTACLPGLPRPLGGYQPMVMEAHSPATAWQYHPVIPKQEPEEERNDSGINSGSDFQASSPGSDNSDFANTTTTNTVTHSTPQPPFYAMNYQYQYQSYNDHPLTPPNSEPLPSPKPQEKTEEKEKEAETTLTPCQSPKEPRRGSEEEDALRRLQMALEKNGLLENALSPNRESDNDEEVDEMGVRVPKVNAHGKIKTFKCKQCDFVAITKMDFWEHSKSHIKADKLLTCPKCAFVTEYKHHLEYHLRNHFGSKPFKCSQCNYSCVNKSMLNSHLKSHSNIYQYRCADCSYATKYCHSLKLHLRKYSHKPAMVLNPDGTPNPLPIIDVYGTRRGPKLKTTPKLEDTPKQDMFNMNPLLAPQQLFKQEEAQKPEALPFALNQILMNRQMQLPFTFPFFGGFPTPVPNPLLLQNLEKLVKDGNEDKEPEQMQADPNGALDLSKPTEETPKNRRKGVALKYTSNPNSEGSSDEEETTMFSNVEVVQDKKEEQEGNNNNNDFNCQYCNINFGDAVLYTMHMGYHGYKNPFACNMCGEECQDKVSFFLHIARTPHS